MEELLEIVVFYSIMIVPVLAVYLLSIVKACKQSSRAAAYSRKKAMRKAIHRWNWLAV